MNILLQYPFPSYVLRTILLAGLLYSYYKLFLANRSYHLFNRFFLLSIPPLSMLLPFLQLPFGGILWHPERQILASPAGTPLVTDGIWQETDALPTSPGTWSSSGWTTLAAIAYTFIALVWLYSFFRQLRYIQRLTQTSPMEKIGNIRFFTTGEPDAPFSFLNRIFWNDQLDMTSPLGRQIFRHELHHIRQKHSFDLLLLRPLAALCWINPFFHLLCREIKTIHEFLADKEAIAEGDRYQYAEGLVWHTVRNPPSSLLHPFFQSPIKRRIIMITQCKNSRTSPFSRVMILPLLFLLCVAFAAKRPSTPNIRHIDRTPLTVVIDAGHGGIDPGAINKAGIQEKDINLSVAEKISRLGSQYDIRILMTRDRDELAGNTTSKRESLVYRAQLANDNKADLFIAIHTDLQTSAYVKGFNIYVAENNPHYAQCVELGSALTATLQKTYTTGVALKKRKENIYVLHNTNMPAVLLSFGNMNNEEDLSFIRKDANQEKVARDILEGIRAYADNHPAGQ